MNQKKKILGIVAILTVYTLIAIIGFFIAYFIKTTFVEKLPGQTPQVQTPLSPVPSDFKIYQDSDNTFSIYYPETLTVKESPSAFGVATVEMRSPENTDTNYAPDFQLLSVPKHLASAIGESQKDQLEKMISSFT